MLVLYKVLFHNLKGSSVWQSDNAGSFIAQYAELISNMRDATDSFLKYQDKIDKVVQEFVGFDQTINH